MATDERALWDSKYRQGSHTSLEPDPFLVSACSEFLVDRGPGTALDLAGGAGRHALWLAERGWKVKLQDISEAGTTLAEQRFSAMKRSAKLPAKATLETEVVDLKHIKSLGRAKYDLVIVFFYLERPLFPALICALKRDGLLLYKTYTVEQRRFKSGPRHPLHLLRQNELLRAFGSLQILHYHETIHTKGVAELAARKP